MTNETLELIAVAIGALTLPFIFLGLLAWAFI